MITRPLPLGEGIEFLLGKEQLPAGEWNSADWASQEPEFRAKAFFSANVESARFLDRAQGLIFDFLVGATEEIPQPDGTTETALRIGSRADFVRIMREFMLSEGMASEAEFEGNVNDITDIRSNARLSLIFDTNVRQAYGFGQWKQGQKPAVLYRFPAGRLVRVRTVMEPRDRHQANLGEVLLKNDRRWAEFHNAEEIGGFGVPWGPYGFNSGVTQEDVSREEAIRLGLNPDRVAPTPGKITDGLDMPEAPRMDPELKARLRAKVAEMKRNLGEIDPIADAKRAGEEVRRELLRREAERNAR